VRAPATVLNTPTAMIVVGAFLLLACWVLSAPPMSSPDEAAHLVRAISASEGQWRGAEVPVPPGQHATTEMLNSRWFRVPERVGVIVRDW
jgi:hypothetical protein